MRARAEQLSPESALELSEHDDEKNLYELLFFFFFQAEDGIRDLTVTGVQTCALPISLGRPARRKRRLGQALVEGREGDLADELADGAAVAGHEGLGLSERADPHRATP